MKPLAYFLGKGPPHHLTHLTALHKNCTKTNPAQKVGSLHKRPTESDLLFSCLQTSAGV